MLCCLSRPDLFNMCVPCWERWEPARRKTGVSPALWWSDPTSPLPFSTPTSPKHWELLLRPHVLWARGWEGRTRLTHKSDSWQGDIKGGAGGRGKDRGRQSCPVSQTQGDGGKFKVYVESPDIIVTQMYTFCWCQWENSALVLPSINLAQ